MKRKQQGATLLVVLVLLVLMLFMGMALLKSTSLAGLISGNTASKIISTQISDIALTKAEEKLNTIQSETPSGEGYVLSQKNINNSIPGGIPAADNTEWSTAVNTGIYSYRYLIEKLCDEAGENCQTKTITSDGKDYTDQLYRITIQISGPKNTRSYVQAFYSK